MTDLPSQVTLASALNQTFHLIDAANISIPVELIDVPTAPALDEDYICYAAVIRLAPGDYRPQDTYLFKHSDGRQWPLFFTPNRPERDGRNVMSATIHTRHDVFASGAR